ncbi:BA75_01573T0 [Komagataella pastoris]|uniref:BA75_01573T0 n=1 Tax=Komagataella pastoris TaxID=4922 RepID=A0A1B2J8G3_PICPA|nr:BA75_01573T0 [Komagataella pastoris]
MSDRPAKYTIIKRLVQPIIPIKKQLLEENPSHSLRLLSLYRRHLRLRPFISPRADIKQFYTDLVRLRFKENLELRRKQFTTPYAPLDEESIIERVIRTLEIVNNGCVDSSNSIERQIIRNILDVEYANKNIKMVPLMSVEYFKEQLWKGRGLDVVSEPKLYDWVDKIKTSNNSKKKNEQINLLTALKNHYESVASFNEVQKTLL